MAYHPEIQHLIAEMVLAIEGASPQVERVADDWSNGVDHGGNWPSKLVAAKHNAVEAAKKVVDNAMAISGGAGMFKSNELERLYRDVRCGGFHPATTMLVHEIVGKTALGIELGEQPRWG
jgi:alkylation response protein AidB-like acyl-CoA dehydrogenase